MRTAYEVFDFHRVYRALYDFATVDLSAFYFDILKDRLYTAPAGSSRRRAAQTVLYKIVDALVRLTAPILCFTADEVWSYLPADGGRHGFSVHLSEFPEPTSLNETIPVELRDRLKNWSQLIAVRQAVLKALEEARQDKLIGGSLEAKVGLEVYNPGQTVSSSQIADLEAFHGLLEEYRRTLPSLFIVSQVDFFSAGAPDYKSELVPSLEVCIHKADGTKCERCWNYSTHVGENSRYPTICERCSAALAEIEGAASASHAS